MCRYVGTVGRSTFLLFVYFYLKNELLSLRLKVRNEWAHSNFSKWTITMFNDAIKDMQCLVTNINLSADVEKEVCDNLEDWKNKGISFSYL